MVSDAGQLQALMAFKAAVDGNNILKGEWVPSGRFVAGVGSLSLSDWLWPTTVADVMMVMTVRRVMSHESCASCVMTAA